MHTPDSPQALAKVELLEARLEALEFLVLTMFRANRDDLVLKRNVITTLVALDVYLKNSELHAKPSYANACLSAFLDIVQLAWDDRPASNDQQARTTLN